MSYKVQVGDIDRPDHKELRGDRGLNCKERAKAALVFGFVVGATVGGFYGAAAACRARLQTREFARTVGKTMFNFGGTFGVFMCIGAALRCY